MTDKVKEALSAIIDGEAGPLETRRLLDEIAQDDRLREKWDRLHLARSVIAGEALDTADSAEAIRRLWNAVDEGEEIVDSPRRHRRFGLRARAAILGVAAALVLAVWLYPAGDFGGGRDGADQVAEVTPPATLPEDTAWEALSVDDRARAQAYMLQHLRRHSMASRAHPIPIAKLANYRPRPQPDPRMTGDE